MGVWFAQLEPTMNGEKCKFVVFGCLSLLEDPLPDFVSIKISDQVLYPSSDVK